MNTIRTIFIKGTEMNLIENEWYSIIDSGNEDNIYVSNGFICAINEGKMPTLDTTNEFHHIFLKDDDYGYRAHKVNFK